MVHLSACVHLSFLGLAKKQPADALSSTDTENKAAVSATYEAVSLKRILSHIGLHQKNTTA